MELKQAVLPLALSAALVTGGCASPPETSEREAAQASSDKQAQESVQARPSWASQSHGRDEGAHWFVGVGSALDKAQARESARKDAQSEFARQVGVDVTSVSRTRRVTETGENGISALTSSRRETFTQEMASAWIDEAEFEYVSVPGQSSGYQVWARMVVPTATYNEARDRVERERDEKLERLADAESKLQAQRAGVEASDLVYARATRRASVSADSSNASRAIAKARHNARVALTERIHGLYVERFGKGEGASSMRSYQTSSGHIRYKDLNKRAWQLDGVIHAEVTLFGWADPRERQ